MILLNGLDMWHSSMPWSGPSPLATSWIFQINLIIFFALCGFCILNFSTSCLLIAQSLPSRCSLVPLWFVFTWKPLALKSNFLWSFNTISQSQKQAMSIFLWSLIIVHQSNQHKTHAVKCAILWIWMWDECWPRKQCVVRGWSVVSSCATSSYC